MPRSRPWPVLAVPLLVALAAAVAPRSGAADAVKSVAPAELDRKVMAETKDHAEVMKNLQHLSDVIGPRLTGSKQLERANQWAAEVMKKYGLENVRQEWLAGTVTLKDLTRRLMLADTFRFRRAAQ